MLLQRLSMHFVAILLTFFGFVFVLVDVFFICSRACVVTKAVALVAYPHVIFRSILTLILSCGFYLCFFAVGSF